MKLGIVTVTYNSAKIIEGFLNSLFAQTFTNWQLYIIDSNSIDNTLNIINKYPNSQINISNQPTNVGFATGSNIGINLALIDGCNAIMLINNDVEFDPSFFQLMIDEYNKSKAEVITPKILYYQPKNKIWCAGGSFKPNHAWAAKHIGLDEIDTGQYDKNYYCEFTPLCCALINKAAFEQIGLLDDKFFIYSEDADWFYRAKLNGLKLMYCYKPTLYHKVSSLTGGLNSKFAVQTGTRNRIYFIKKHFNGLERITFIIKYFTGMFVSLINGKYSFKEFRWRLPAFFKGIFY